MIKRRIVCAASCTMHVCRSTDHGNMVTMKKLKSTRACCRAVVRPWRLHAVVRAEDALAARSEEASSAHVQT